MKVLITGSRNCPSKEVMWSLFETYIPKMSFIINGGAKGVDSLCNDWCNSFPKRVLGWETIRPINERIAAYYLHRNAEMIGMCDKVIAFWDGKSRGTKFTIDYAKSRNKEVKVVHTR